SPASSRAAGARHPRIPRPPALYRSARREDRALLSPVRAAERSAFGLQRTRAATDPGGEWRPIPQAGGGDRASGARTRRLEQLLDALFSKPRRPPEMARADADRHHRVAGPK